MNRFSLLPLLMWAFFFKEGKQMGDEPVSGAELMDSVLAVERDNG